MKTDIHNALHCVMHIRCNLPLLSFIHAVQPKLNDTRLQIEMEFTHHARCQGHVHFEASDWKQIARILPLGGAVID